MLLHFGIDTFFPVFVTLIHLEDVGSVGFLVIAEVASHFVPNSVLSLLVSLNLEPLGELGGEEVDVLIVLSDTVLILV